ncbi:MAG: hypothetical protein EOM53_04035, partial [Alphaproteobacteria bacterium]|nr:hypothetical protein [Alphaproteobacteria bacterium]
MKRFLRLLNAISFAVFMISSNQVLAGGSPPGGDYINDILAPQLGAQYYQPKDVTGSHVYEQAGVSDGNTANWMNGVVNVSYTKTCTSSDPCDKTINVSKGNTYGNLIVPADYDSNKYLGPTAGEVKNTIYLTTVCSNTTSGTCTYTGKGIYLGPVILDTSTTNGELQMKSTQSLVPIYRKDLVLSLVMDASGTFKFNGKTSDTGVFKEGFIVDSGSSVVFNNGSGATVNPALQFYQFTRAVKVNSATSVTFNIKAQFYNNASDLEGVGLYVAAPPSESSTNQVIFNKEVDFNSNTSTSTGGGAVHNLGTISVLNGSGMTLSGNSAV